MKKSTIIFALMFMSLCALAQEKLSDEEINARVNVLSAQRNSAMDTVVVLQARVFALESDLKKARAACPEPKDQSKGK